MLDSRAATTILSGNGSAAALSADPEEEPETAHEEDPWEMLAAEFGDAEGRREAAPGGEEVSGEPSGDPAKTPDH